MKSILFRTNTRSLLSGCFKLRFKIRNKNTIRLMCYILLFWMFSKSATRYQNGVSWVFLVFWCFLGVYQWCGMKWVNLLFVSSLTLSWRRSLWCRNQSIDLQSKSMDWFLYHRDLRHERVNILIELYFNHLIRFNPFLPRQSWKIVTERKFRSNTFSRILTVWLLPF